MRLGLVTDIHEQVEDLRTALAHFQDEGVEQVIVIGDLFEIGERIDETCRLLSEADALGVWGNHDFGFCVDPPEELRRRYGDSVIDFMASLQPRLDIAGCLFTHVEPWLDPNKIDDLWYFEGPPDETGKLARIFHATPHRIMFTGHYHKWLLATPSGIDGWIGGSPITLDDGRYFVVVGAVCEGRFATFDTDTFELVPYNLR